MKSRSTWGQQEGQLNVARRGCPQMPLADLQIGKAKPGWKPVRTKKRKVPVPNSRKFESTGKKNKLAE
jgi:hypothetical protein